MGKKYLLLIGLLLIGTSLFMIVRGLVTPEEKTYVKTANALEKDISYEIGNTVENEEKLDPQFHAYLVSKYSKPIGAIEYLFSVASIKDMNHFPNAFISEQYFKDVFDKPDSSEKVIHTIMDKLTRQGTFTSIKFIKEMKNFEKNSKRVIVDLYYSDLSNPIRVNVKVKQAEPNNYFYIDSSVWDIINKIEKGA